MIDQTSKAHPYMLQWFLSTTNNLEKKSNN